MDKKRNTLKQQFVQHCAIIIQSRWKGYVQRKRYRKFLPIYRRVKELLISIYLGWKVRKIFKLRSIKTQIIDIKECTNKKHLSQVRIAKRQLIDQIARLSKKGQWIDEIKRSKKLHQNNMKDSKQNSSLYANVKSKSIKNIFKPIVQSHHKIQINNKAKINQNRSYKNFQQNKFNKQTPLNIDSIQQKNMQLLPQKQLQKIKPILRKSMKGRKIISYQEPLNKPSQICNNKALNHKSQMKSLKNNSSISAANQQQVIHQEPIHQSIKNQPKQNKKKIEVTISKSSTNNSKQQARQNGKKLLQSQFKLSQLQKSVKTQISQLINSKVSNKSNQRDIHTLIQTYESTYTKKNQQLKQKLALLDTRYTLSMKQNYKNILNKLRIHLI